MDARELQKLRPVREVVELQEHFTIGCTTAVSYTHLTLPTKLEV